MLHTKFQGHQPFSPEKIFQGFLPYIGMAAILVLRPWSHTQTFIPWSQRDSICTLVSINPAVLEKKLKKTTTATEASRIKVSKWSWPLVFIEVHSADCINQLWCNRLQQSEKNLLFYLFPIQKTEVTEFDLAIKKVRVNQGSSFEQTW